MSLACGCQELLEPSSGCAATGTPQILIYYLDIAPAELACPLDQAVLPPATLQIVHDLVKSGLTDIHDGTPAQMFSGNLCHDRPPMVFRDPRIRSSLQGLRSTAIRATPVPFVVALVVVRLPVDSRTGSSGELSTSPCLSPPAGTWSSESKPNTVRSRNVRNSRSRLMGRRGVVTIFTAPASGEAIQLGKRCVVPSSLRTSRWVIP